jgi:hypothetical protein
MELNRLESLVVDLRRLWDRAQRLGEDAEREGDRRAALSAIRESRECLGLLAKFTGDLDERPQVNVLFAPEWRTVQVVVLEALLAGHPIGHASQTPHGGASPCFPWCPAHRPNPFVAVRQAGGRGHCELAT